MDSSIKYKVLRIYLSNTDKIKHTSVYEAIAFQAKQYGFTVYKGMMGYGVSSNLNPVKFWEFTEKVPVIVEIIDEEDKINSFVKKITLWLDLIPKGCMITCQDVDVILLKKGKGK